MIFYLLLSIIALSMGKLSERRVLEFNVEFQYKIKDGQYQNGYIILSDLSSEDIIKYNTQLTIQNVLMYKFNNLIKKRR